MAAVYAAASAAVGTILSGIELDVINSPYVCEQQPLIVRAVSNAKDVLRAFQSSIMSSTLQQDIERDFDASVAVAVGAVGHLAQTVGVSASLTLHALHSAAAIVSTSNRASLSAAPLFGQERVPAASASSAPANASTVQGRQHDTAVLRSAVHLALHTRFTPVSRHDESTVGSAIVDVLASVLRHCKATELPATVLQALFAALVRICVDGVQPQTVRSRACSLLIESAPSLASAASRQGGTVMTGFQASVLELMNMLCDVLGTDAADVPLVPQELLPHTRVLLPPCALVHTYMPLPIEVEPMEHLRYAPTHALLGLDAGGEESRVQVDWTAYEKRVAASEANAQHSGSALSDSPAATDVGSTSSSASAQAQGTGMGQRKPSFSSASSPLTVTPGNEARLIDAVPRVLAVHDSAPLFALRVLSSMLGQAEGTDSASAFRRSTAILAKQRICLALCWMSDGCGPDDTALSHVHPSAWGQGNKGGAGLFSGLFGSASKQEGEEGPRRSFRSLAGATPGSGGGGSLLIPRLPCLRSSLEMLLVLVRDPVLAQACRHEVLQLLLRVILRGLTAPARLVYAAAAQVTPLSALRVVMDQLCELQKFRGRNASSAVGAAASAATLLGPDGRPNTAIDANGPADILPLTGAELNAATKSVVGALGIASKRSVREGGPDLSAAIDPESIRALVQLLHPRSAMMLTSVACLEALQELVRANPSLPCAMFQHGDGQLGGHDALRGTCQMLAAMALGEAHVHTLHGVLSISGDTGAGSSSAAKGSNTGPLPLPLPDSTRHTAYDTLLLLLANFHQNVAQPVLTDLSPAEVQSQLDDATLSLRSNLRFKRLLQSCAKTFNGKPTRGVEALRATGLLELVTSQMAHPLNSNGPAGLSSPGPAAASSAASSTSAAHQHHAAVAHLLKWYGGAAGFDPVAVGQYLGAGEGAEEDGKRRAHAAAFVQECAGKPLLTALRTYLSSFRLPGEAQQIDRILQAFAGLAHTVCSESGLLPSIDATYLLTFSIIMLNTDLHNPAIRPERRMTEDGFVRNNTYYGDEMCHGRKIPEATLRAIYKEIRDNPIAPPPASFALLPVLAPSTDAGSSAGAAATNTAVAQAFVSSGDAISFADWQAVSEGPLQSSDKGDMSDCPEAILTCAAWRAAVPEVWHAAVRVGLAGFTAAFRNIQTNAVLPPSGRQNMPLSGTDAIKYQARSHLRTLAACAGMAAACNMTSGMDIVISALCRIATHSLKCPYEVALHGNDVDARGGDGSVRGALGALASALFGGHPAPSSLPAERDRSRYTGTGRPSSGSEASLALDGSSGFSAPVQAVVTPVRHTAAGLTRAAHAHAHGGQLGRQPSFLAMSPPPLLEDDAGQDERGEHSQYFTAVSHAASKIADDFLSDLRAQMALSAAIAISMPEAQGGHGAKLGEHGWKWLAVCMLRLHRCGLWSLPPSVHDPFSSSGRVPRRASPTADGTDDDQHISPAGSAGPGEEGMLQPLTSASLSSLCHAYCLASAQARYAQRLHRAALAKGLSRTTFANAFRAQNSAQRGKSAAGDSTQHGPQHVQSSQAEPGVIGGILGWFFGSSDPATAPPPAAPVQRSTPQGTASSDTTAPKQEHATDIGPDSDEDDALITSSDIVDVNALLTGSEAEFAELSAVLAEEPDTDSSSDVQADVTLGRESPDMAELAVPKSSAAGRPVGLAIRRPVGAHTASIEALAANINLLLSSAGSLPGDKLMTLARVFAWASSLPEAPVGTSGSARGSSSVSGSGAAADDDGSAFISGMETCRFKCALLSPPAELPSTTSAARTGILVHAFVLSFALPSGHTGTASASPPHARAALHSSPNEIFVVTLREILSTAEAATSRVRTAATGLLLLASSHLSVAVHSNALATVSGTHADPSTASVQWIRDALYELCDAQPPCGGMLRILIVSWLYSLYVHSPPLFAYLSAQRGGGSEEGIGLSQILVLASQQGWSDDVEAELPTNELDESMDTEGTDELSWLVGGGSDHRHVLSVSATTVGRMVVRLAAALLRQQVQNTPADGEPSLAVLPALARYANHRVHESFSSASGPSLSARLMLEDASSGAQQGPGNVDSAMEGSVELSLDAMDAMVAAMNLALSTLPSHPERWRAVSQLIVVLSNPCCDPRPAVRLHALALLQDVLCRAVQGLQQAFEIGRDLTSVVQTLLDLAVTTAEKVQEVSLFPGSAEAHGLTPLLPAQALSQGQGVQSDAVCERTVLVAAELGSKVWLAVITSPPEVLQYARLNAYQDGQSAAPSPRSLQAEAEAWLQQGWNRVARLLEPDTLLGPDAAAVVPAESQTTEQAQPQEAQPVQQPEEGKDAGAASTADGAAAMPEQQSQPVVQTSPPVVHLRLSPGLAQELTLLARKVVTVTEGHTQAVSPVPA